MRRILIDFARSHHSEKRAGGAPHLSLDGGLVISAERRADLVALDDTVKALAAVDEGKRHVVELRFFRGIERGRNRRGFESFLPKVMGEWRVAKAWLLRELGQRVVHGA